MEPFINVDFKGINCETSNRFDVRQEISYISALAFEKYNKVQFIDKACGKVHHELDFIMVDTCQENPLDEPIYAAWNNDGTRFFFLGYVDPIHDLHNFKERWKRWAMAFVVVDMANKAIMKIYQPDVEQPRWNADGTMVLFDNQPTEIADFDAFIDEKTQDYAFGLSSTFSNAMSGQPVEEVDEDLAPLGFMEGRTVLMEQLSPDKDFVVRFYILSMPPGGPLRMTFSLFQRHNEIWHPIYDLPDSYYCEDGTDHFVWCTKSRAITFSVNGMERVLIYDFFYHKLVQTKIPENTMECYWHENNHWVFKSPTGISKFFLSYPEVTRSIYLNWRNTTIILSRTSRRGDAEPYLYQVAFYGENAVATCPYYVIQGRDSIRISEKGWVSFQAFDPERTRQYLVYCDLGKFGQEDKFRLAAWELPLVPERFDWDESVDNSEESRWQPIVHGHRVVRHQLLDHILQHDLPVIRKKTAIPTYDIKPYANASDLYTIVERKDGVDRFGLPNYTSLDFVERQSGQTHFSIKFCMDLLSEENNPKAYPVYHIWNKQGTKFFFTGSALPKFEFRNSSIQGNHYGRLLVVVDVENKEIVDIYKFEPCDPRWNVADDQVVFSHPLERHEACLAEAKGERVTPKFVVPDGAKVMVCPTEEPDHPGVYRVCINSDSGHCFARLDYYVTSKDAIGQSGNIVCAYCSDSPTGPTQCIIRFDLQDIFTQDELEFDVWDLHTTPSDFEWDESAARWWPIINGKLIRPNRFYYDDQFMQSVRITRP